MEITVMFTMRTEKKNAFWLFSEKLGESENNASVCKGVSVDSDSFLFTSSLKTSLCVKEPVFLFRKSMMCCNSMFIVWFTVELLVVQLKPLFCRLKILTELLLQRNSDITFKLTLQKSRRTSFNKRPCPWARLFPYWMRRKRRDYALYLIYCLIPRI